jgi:hypothetical protein
VTYPQPPVGEIIEKFTVPVQIDNSNETNAETVDRFKHIWTPDLRVLDPELQELVRWDGYLPPPEFMARLVVSLGLARLRRREFDKAEQHYIDVLRRFPTSFAAPEAQYYLGVTRYRADPESNELLHQWAMLRSRYPASEYRLKQSFKELP